MAAWIRMTLLAAALTVLQSALAGNVCYGGALLDWLAGRSPYYQPRSQTTYAYAASPAAVATVPVAGVAPVTQTLARPTQTFSPATQTVMPGQGFVGLAPNTTVVAAQPIVAQPAVPATMAPTGCWGSGNSCFQRPASAPIPQVRYRSQWVQIPVTVYRPVTGTDPMTGCPTTCLQPCTTTRWQLQRVPVVTYRPRFRCLSWLGNLFRCRCLRQPAPVCPPTCPPAVGTTTVVPGAAAPSVTMPPYYSSPSPGAMTVPGPAPGATLVPGQSLPSGAAGTPSPADIPPSLQPNPGSSPPGASTRAVPSQGNSAESSGNRRDLSTPVNARQPVYVTPVPDPEMPRMSPPRHDPPQLLNPRDRTAAVGGWEVVPISWSVAAPSPRQRATPRGVDFDDSGWRSAM
jgi:hypothetical protein